MFFIGPIGLPELIFLLPLVFWIWALVDILKSKFTYSNKIIWLLIVSFVPIIGFILYFLIGRKQKVRA